MATAHEFSPATKPTLYFIGVTTRQSAINAVFPRWAAHLGLGDCELRGWDFKLRDDPARFRAAIDFIKHDPFSLGALVTTHKVDLCAACHDQFDELEPLSRSMGEVCSIYKRHGRLHGRATDPWTSGHALGAFLPRDHWQQGAEVLILGAGGAGTALVWQLTRAAAQRPVRVHLADLAVGRLEHVRRLHASWPEVVPLEAHHVARPEAADAILARLPPGSLVVNATGLGKDAPGSPLTNAAVFPERGIAWEFNYRGQLEFLGQARAQQLSRGLCVEDGWTYFLHGWTHVMADVFQREIPAHGPQFEELSRIAATTR